MIIRRFTLGLVAVAFSTPVLAFTAEQEALISEFWDNTGECRVAFEDMSPCDRANELYEQILNGGICRVDGTGDGDPGEFQDCDVTNPSGTSVTEATEKVVFDYEAVRQTFKMLQPQDRRYVQRKLQEAGYYNSSIDGAFGPGTAGALEAMAIMISEENDLEFDMTSFDGVRNALGYILTYEVNLAE